MHRPHYWFALQAHPEFVTPAAQIGQIALWEYTYKSIKIVCSGNVYTQILVGVI
jgi:hypothetical protein